MQEEFPIHDDNEVSQQLMISPIAGIIPANDFIFVIDWNGFCVALHEAENSSIASYSMFYSLPKNISYLCVFLTNSYKIDIIIVDRKGWGHMVLQ